MPVIYETYEGTRGRMQGDANETRPIASEYSRIYSVNPCERSMKSGLPIRRLLYYQSPIHISSKTFIVFQLICSINYRQQCLLSHPRHPREIPATLSVVQEHLDNFFLLTKNCNFSILS